MKNRRKTITRAVLAALAAAVALSGLVLTGCEESGGTTMWFESPMKKILENTEPVNRPDYTVYMAREEYEGCQAVFRYKYTVGSARVEVSEPVNEKGAVLKYEVFAEHYVPTVYSLPFFADETLNGVAANYPDALKPLPDEIPFYSNTSTPVYILFDSHGAEAGDYRSTVTVTENGKVLDSGEITIHVWQFELPAKKTMQTAVGLSRSDIAALHNLTDSDKIKEIYKKYYDFLLEHNCSSYTLPYDILDERADKYMDDPRVTSFRVPYSDNDDTIRAYYRKLSTKQEWLKKAYFYPIDEPAEYSDYMRIIDVGRRLNELFPGYRLCVPFFIDPEMGDGSDAITQAAEVINVWCPKLHVFDSSNIYNDVQMAREKPFAERMLDERREGDDVWCYVCWEPGDPYANLYVNMQGVKNRAIFWQADVYGVNGFLYWCVNFWEQIKDPWKDQNTVKWLTSYVYGDGSLVYNGNAVGVDGACSSLRLEAVRDGVDDYELIQMARRLGVPEKVVEKAVGIVARSVSDYTDSDGDIQNARYILGTLIEREYLKTAGK
ncbi:MAG: DUF4091 domain-containing protein [Clostridia bacterium]|nr:DUF4091 domain-containing protein [Clostridia bacterium]